MTRCNYIYIIIFLLLNQCADFKVAREAINYKCNVPSINHAFLEISSIEATGTTKDLKGFYKYFTYVFKQPFFDVVDRCTHTKIIINGLYDNEDHKVHFWNNLNNKTSGKMAVFLTREYDGKICRDYYTIISNSVKKYYWQGTACMGSPNQLSNEAIVHNSYWNFYSYSADQSSGRPILKSFGTYNDAEHPNIREKNYFLYCSRERWKCG